ncbi:hypothetical protein LSAT2_029744 [Lamellibrachia satsuma]|nr:hypothetical protein LSAT2_029744 [Lamellibrachia satsuma]
MRSTPKSTATAVITTIVAATTTAVTTTAVTTTTVAGTTTAVTTTNATLTTLSAPEGSTVAVTSITWNDGSMTSKTQAGNTTNSHRTIALIVGLTTALCVAVIVALIVIIGHKRCRRSTSYPSLESQTSPQINLYDIPVTNQSTESVTNLHNVAAYTDPSYNASVNPDQRVQPVAPSGDTSVTPPNIEASSYASLDDLYSRPNKQRKRRNVSKDDPHYDNILRPVTAGGMGAGGLGAGTLGVRLSVAANEDVTYTEIDHTGVDGGRSWVRSTGVIYAEIQPERNGNAPDGKGWEESQEIPGDTDMTMVENDLYGTQ